MYKNARVAVVVPAYSEERLIETTVDSIPGYVDDIVVVDDCSQDRTAARVLHYQDCQPGRLRLLQNEKNQGVGGSIAAGYKWCRDQEVDVAVVMAGDAQMDPADMPDLLEPVVAGEVDYAKGNRLFTGDAWNKIPRVRYLDNSGLSLLTKIASGYWHVADSQCVYAAINLPALKAIDWDRMYKRYSQPNDLMILLNVYNFRVRDVPVRPVYNVGESSGIRPLRLIPRLSWLLLKLLLWRMKEKYIIRDFHPLLFFYAMGVFLFFPALLLGSNLVFLRITQGPVAGTTAHFAALLVIMELQSIFFAMWFDMEYNREYK